MRKLKEIFRLSHQGMLHRQIAQSCGVARRTVSNYLTRFACSGLSWPLPDELTESELEQKLFPPHPPVRATEEWVVPDWKYVHLELKRKAVNLHLLWQEYREQHPTAYQTHTFSWLWGRNQMTQQKPWFLIQPMPRLTSAPPTRASAGE